VLPAVVPQCGVRTAARNGEQDLEVPELVIRQAVEGIGQFPASRELEGLTVSKLRVGGVVFPAEDG
jgi:hypothetical protein